MSRGVFVTDEQVRLTGSPNVARFLAQCLYWSNIDLVKNRQGWFYKSRDEWKAETWLSRYQQEKARKWLRDAGLLRESRERLQTGIRLWFWLDQALYNRMINNLAEQPVLDETEDCSDDPDALYDSSLIDEPESNTTDDVDVNSTSTESNDTVECKTIVPIKPLKELKSSFKPEISTNVLDNNQSVETENSDVSCDADFEIDLDLETYKSCHPFIYQYMQTRVLSGLEQDQNLRKCFAFDGFNQHVVDDLEAFINRYGHNIIRWYRDNTPVEVKPMAMDDLNFAAQVSIKRGAS